MAKRVLVNSNLQSVDDSCWQNNEKLVKKMSVKVMDFENGSREPSSPNVA
jgi:hypothetical protein